MTIAFAFICHENDVGIVANAHIIEFLQQEADSIIEVF